MTDNPHARAQAFLVEKLQWSEPTWEAIVTIHRSQLCELLTVFESLAIERCAKIVENPQVDGLREWKLAGNAKDWYQIIGRDIAQAIRESKGGGG